jgi:nicotinate-nucleotide adenylyltransferase
MTRDEAALWQGSRIGVFGGTFDPPHAGHLGMARHARATLGLDRVLFSVAPRPPHKAASRTSPLEHRVAMMRLATRGDDALDLTHVEEGHDVSFSVDLLRACRARTRADLYFIIGADSLAELHTWRDPEEILRLATLVVFARDETALRLDVAGPSAMVVFEQPRFDVSSTEVRRRIAAGAAPADLVAADVAAYAARQGLYSG